MSDIKPPSRDQLAKFLPTPDLIKAFEKLWASIGDSSTDLTEVYALLDDGAITTALATAKADEAVSAVNRLADAVTIASLRPDDNRFIDYLSRLKPAIDNRTAIDNILSLTTGVISGGVVSINGGDNTKFDVTAGHGVIVDWTDVYNPHIVDVTWPAFTAESIPDITKLATAVEIDENGTLIKTSTNTETSASRRRHYIKLDSLVHTGSIITAVSSLTIHAYEMVNALYDHARFAGPINSGNTISANSLLTVTKAAGFTSLPSINFHIDPQNPSIKTNAQQTTANLFYAYRNGSGGFTYASSVTNISPSLYDNGTGTLAAVPNNKFTIQRFYFFGQQDSVSVSYGQNYYGSISDAQAEIFNEAPVLPPIFRAATFVTALIVKKGATDLTDPTHAKFIAISSSGSSVAPATTLQDAYDTSLTTEITTNSTNGALTIKRGSAADGDDVLEVLNGAGTKTFSVQGDGDVTANSFNGVPLTDAGAGTLFLADDGTYSSPGAGSVPSLNVICDFGASFTDKARTVVTGQTWVTGTSKIIPQVLTPLSADPDEMYLLNIRAVISELIAGVGFTITLYSESEAKGQYSVMCIGA